MSRPLDRLDIHVVMIDGIFLPELAVDFASLPRATSSCWFRASQRQSQESTSIRLARVMSRRSSRRGPRDAAAPSTACAAWLFRLVRNTPVRCCDLHLDLYVRSLHADRVARDAARRGCAQHCAGLDVIDGPMPRARDLLARHLALRERAATVGAGVVDGVEAPLQVEE